MKKILWAFSVLLITFSAQAQDDRYYDNNGSTDDVYGNQPSYDEQEEDKDGTSYQAFYDDLNPYGSWIQNPTYGYVWVPLQAGAGFSPYLTNGHWEYTDLGWTWVSDFDWGWATFHYGRWFQDPGYGWMWAPGSEWAPAWVVWGEYSNYYCWAPVGPGEYISRHYGERDHHWNFVEHNYINDHNVSNHVVSNTVVNHDGGNVEDHISIISHVSTFNRSVFFAGPKSKEVEKAIGRPVEKVNLTAAAKAGPTRVTGNQISIYRPDIKREEKQAAPAHVGRSEDLPRNNNTPAASQPQRAAPERINNNNSMTAPARQQQQPVQQQWTPPRQSAPRQEMPQSRPIQSAPINRGGGFVPQDRPAMQTQPQRQFSAPAPVRSAPMAAPMHMSGGGGRH